MANFSAFSDIVKSRFPVKQSRDALSLLQIALRGDPVDGKKLSWGEKLKCLKFYSEADGIRRLYVAPARAGSRWIQLGIALALDLAAGGDGEYTYDRSKDDFYPTKGQIWKRLDWRVPTGAWEKLASRTDHTGIGHQQFFLFHHPYFQLRTKSVANFKTVIVTRSILSILESRFIKLAHAPYVQHVYLEKPETFDWEGELRRIIAFHNSWGDVLRWHPHIRHFKFEDLKKDTVNGFNDLLNFWGYDVPNRCIDEAFARVTKNEMLKRMGTDKTNQRITTLAKSERGRIPGDFLRYAVATLNRELIHDFGYAYTTDTDYVQDYR